jgi:tRNA(fMet)-specific endonuclease VapC
VKLALIDTDILSMFFRGNANVIAQFQPYLAEHGQISLSIVTYYEVPSGLKHRDAQKQLALFLKFTTQNIILPLTVQSVTISADIYAKLRQDGTPIDGIDLLIAGVALANNLVLVTHNQRHFNRIESLELQDWS